MRVTEVTTTIRYSAEGKGAWRSIEVGATATLTASDETLETAQQELYARLSRQLKTLWANGHGNSKPAQEQSLPETPEPPQEHWCSTHQTEYQRFSKDRKVWYSHKAPDGWCKEPGKK
jgi:hypothetical protein